MEYTITEKAILAKAVSKKFNDEVVEPLESQAKAELLEDYRKNGTTNRSTPNLGDSLGSLYIKKGKHVPEETVSVFVVDDEQAIVDWMDETRPDTDSFAAANVKEFASWYFFDTGEMPPGCRLRDESHGGYDTEPTAVLKPDYKKIDEAFAQQLEAATRMMLVDGGSDD